MIQDVSSLLRGIPGELRYLVYLCSNLKGSSRIYVCECANAWQRSAFLYLCFPYSAVFLVTLDHESTE